MQSLRIATYNVHKCKGLDRKTNPSRIVEVLRELDADIIALQEVVSIEGGSREEHQARFIAEKLEMDFFLGETRRLRGGSYGNVLLARLPVQRTFNYDLSVRRREPRRCLRADIEINQNTLHIFNVHLGTAFFERRHQARRLVAPEILLNRELNGPRIMLGDFNEWTRGLTTRMLSTHLRSADIRFHLRRSKTYPGVIPFLHLDHIYFDRSLDMESLALHRSRLSLVASDHLPLVAEIRLKRAG
jgi:endonuclease/exonuclease/phosphatase family metal-dependent hydrolase